MLDSERPRPVAGYLTEELDGEIVLFHPARLKITHLNRSAALVWQLCDGQRTEAEICDLLIAAYPDAAGRIQDDVDEVLSLLKELGALAADGEASDVDDAG